MNSCSLSEMLERSPKHATDSGLKFRPSAGASAASDARERTERAERAEKARTNREGVASEAKMAKEAREREKREKARERRERREKEAKAAARAAQAAELKRREARTGWGLGEACFGRAYKTAVTGRSQVEEGEGTKRKGGHHSLT